MISKYMRQSKTDSVKSETFLADKNGELVCKNNILKWRKIEN